MTREQARVGMRVRYTGDTNNFGEPNLIPREESLGTITIVSHLDSRWDMQIEWDESVHPPFDNDKIYWYKAASISPVLSAGF